MRKEVANKYVKAKPKTIQIQLSSIIIENDFEIAIQSIIRKIKKSRQISNLLSDIIVLAKIVINIQLIYCNRLTNELTDDITKGCS